jgi:hypothetical protein
VVSQFPYSVVTLILAIVCIVRRKEAIGGWLLWFLARAVIDGILTVGALALSFRNFIPATWHDPKLHLIYVLSRPPEHLAAICLALVAIEAARHTDLVSLRRLRVALAVRAVIGAFVLTIDGWFFPDLLKQDASVESLALIMLMYLGLSIRVDRVYVRRDWGAKVDAVTWAGQQPRAT